MDGRATKSFSCNGPIVFPVILISCISNVSVSCVGLEFFVIWKLLARLCLICGPRTIRRVVLVMDPELSAILTSLARLCLNCGSIEPTFILMPFQYLGNSVSHNTVDTVDVRYSYGGAGTSGFTCFLVDRYLKKNSKS